MTGEDFSRALLAAGGERPRDGIGRLGEKSVHAVLKYAYEPHPENHEIPVGGYVADIVGEEGVIEIQTRALRRLGPKLTAFLEVCDVTVVHPVVQAEWILRIDPETGETVRRKSPRRARPFDVLEELAPIRELLRTPRLHLRLVLVDVARQDLGRAGARRRQHLDRRPLAFHGEIALDCPADYRQLLPAGTPASVFTAAEFGKAAGRAASRAREALLTLRALGIVETAGRRGRFNLYRLCPPDQERKEAP